MKAILLLALVTVPAMAQSLQVQVHAFTDATAADEQRVYRGLELLERVVNTQEFRTQLLEMRYRAWGRNYAGFSQTNHTAKQVLETILRAEENFSGGQPGVMDLNMSMYEEVSDTVGYTNPDDPFFHMNRYIQQYYSPAETAGNVFHEWLHKIGYDHSRFNNRFRPHSVPYKLGKLVAEMAADLSFQGDAIVKEMLVQEVLSYECSQARE